MSRRFAAGSLFRRARALAVAPIAVLALSATRCESGVAPSRPERLGATQVFPGVSLPFEVRRFTHHIEVQGTLHPPCAPFDWYTGFSASSEPGDALWLALYTAPRGDCAQDVVETLGYRATIVGVRPGDTYDLEVLHRWAPPGGEMADTLKFRERIVLPEVQPRTR